MIKAYATRIRQLNGFMKFVVLIGLICLHLRLVQAQEDAENPASPDTAITAKKVNPFGGPTTQPPLPDIPLPDVEFTTDLTNAKPIEEPTNTPKTESTPRKTETLEPSRNATSHKNITTFRDGTDIETVLCEDGLILRAWRPLDNITEREKMIRGMVYFFAMLYIFVGVAIVSDRFMESIEIITSSERHVTVINRNGQKEKLSVRVWSETVANLSLMAMGSSAPEILLSIVEMFQKNFEAGDLGPGTIIGSAAFNLFIIVPVCIVVIPKGQVRRIDKFRVFIATGFWSIFAYVWMCLITRFITPNVVDIWEGLLTFLFFPILIYHAYITERRLFCPQLYSKSYEANKRSVIVSRTQSAEVGQGSLRFSVKDLVESPEMGEFEDSRREYIIKLKELHRKYPQYDSEKIQIMAQEHLILDKPKSRAFYRVHSGRRLSGNEGVLKRARGYAAKEIGEAKAQARMQTDEDEEISDDFETRLYFDPCHYTVLKSVGDVALHVIRAGSLKQSTKVEYDTEDGTAEAGSDYVAAHGILEFAPGIEEQIIYISIIHDDIYGEDELFYVHLKNASEEAVIATPKVATIMILDDYHCGIFGFTETEHRIPETVEIYKIEVKRYSGALSKVIVPYYTKEKTALSGKEYMDVKGELVFEHGEVLQTIEIKIIEEHSFEKDAVFEVYLGEPTVSKDDPLYHKINEVKQKPDKERSNQERIILSGAPKLGDGISNIECHIVESEEFKHTVNKLVQTANASKLIGTSTWREQFMDALTVSGGEDFDDDDGEEVGDDDDEDVEDDTGPGVGGYVMHFLSIFWKICFAVIPPSKLQDGYPCFLVCICIIGLLTAVLEDLSSHFGCTLGVVDSVTAICFVAIGTSVPDTFASKVAAIHDKSADNAIGNVNGSNAVNVFLGIGIAWSMGAIYHVCHGNQFVVPAGSLLFSTALFVIEACVAFSIILYRRKESIGELGGPVKLKWFHAIIIFSLWIIYLIVSTLEAYHIIPGF